MKVYNNNQLYKSPAGDQLWNSGRQNWIFGRIGDQEGAISDPATLTNTLNKANVRTFKYIIVI